MTRALTFFFHHWFQLSFCPCHQCWDSGSCSLFLSSTCPMLLWWQYSVLLGIIPWPPLCPCGSGAVSLPRTPDVPIRALCPWTRWLLMVKKVTQSQQTETILGLLLNILKWDNHTFAGVAQMIINKPCDVGNHFHPRVKTVSKNKANTEEGRVKRWGERKPIPDGIL